MNHDSFLVFNDVKKPICEGFILPDGQVAIAWISDIPSHLIFKNFEDYKSIQDRMNRTINFSNQSIDGHYLHSFKLIRTKDETGISGTGIVAVGYCFYNAPDQPVVTQWLGDTSSIGWYRCLDHFERLHACSANSKVEMDF